MLNVGSTIVMESVKMNEKQIRNDERIKTLKMVLNEYMKYNGKFRRWLENELKKLEPKTDGD